MFLSHLGCLIVWWKTTPIEISLYQQVRACSLISSKVPASSGLIEFSFLPFKRHPAGLWQTKWVHTWTVSRRSWITWSSCCHFRIWTSVSERATHPMCMFFLFLWNWIGISICPGRHFSAETLWLISAHMIATMDIGKAIDENGNVITPPLEFTTGFVRFVSLFFLKRLFQSSYFQKVIQNRSNVVLGRDRNKLWCWFNRRILENMYFLRKRINRSVVVDTLFKS